MAKKLSPTQIGAAWEELQTHPEDNQSIEYVPPTTVDQQLLIEKDPEQRRLLEILNDDTLWEIPTASQE